MKHRWKKIRRSSLDQVHAVPGSRIPNVSGDEDDLIQIMHIVKSPRICINCDLRQGYIDTSFFSKRVFYKNRKIKSLERIPYKCPNKKDLVVDVEAKVNNYEFFKQNEFEIST